MSFAFYGQPEKMPKNEIFRCAALSATPMQVNKCRLAITAGLIDRPWLEQGRAGVDPVQLWDCPANGDSDIVPQLSSPHPLLFDFPLKPLLSRQGHSFSPAVFNTRRLFAASHA